MVPEIELGLRLHLLTEVPEMAWCVKLSSVYDFIPSARVVLLYELFRGGLNRY